THPGSDGSPAFSPDGKWIAYLQGGDSNDIWYATNNVAIVPVTGGAPKILTPGLDRNVRSPQFTPDGSKILFLLEEGGNVHLAGVPTTGGAIQRVIDGEHDITSFDVAKSGEIAYLDSQPQQPSEVFFANKRLTHVNDEFLAKVALGPVQRYKAKSADGTQIDSFVTRPANAPSGKLPTILRIHGGPATQHSPPLHLHFTIPAAPA